MFSYTSTKNVQWADYGWLALLYVLANLARGLMIGVLWPVMNCIGGSDVTPLACIDPLISEVHLAFVFVSWL